MNSIKPFASPSLHVSSLRAAVFLNALAVLLAGASLYAAEADSSPMASAAHSLIERVVPQQARHFAVEIIPPENEQDVFEVESHDGEVILRGNNGVSVASALNWYLHEECHCDISWNCGDQLRLPSPLPAVPGIIRIVSPHRFRYAYNFCTHGYTMAWWNWPQWQRELDYLALSGVNLALIIEGQESVWVQTLRSFGYTDAEVRAWLVMPSHQPWMYMDNMEGYGGPVPSDLVAGRMALGRQILNRMRELGIEPVLPGYYGMVPADFQKRYPNAHVHAQGNWGKLKRPDILDPTDPLFPQVAKAFYAAQHALFGGSHFYAADPFHEGGSTANIDMPAAGCAIFDSMQGATWVLQSWQANPRPQMIDDLDKDRLLVLDLFCEDHENWRLRNSFDGVPWLWCTIHNFGGNVDLGGRLDWMGKGPVAAMNDPARGRISGIGALMEGSQVNPVIWELFFGNAWRSTAPDLQSWLRDYVGDRYGARIPAAEQAWKILAETIYNAPVAHGEYPVNSVICARPSLDPHQRAREWASTEPYYDTTELAKAWGLLLAAAPAAKATDGYRHDLCDVGRQVLADLGTRYDGQIIAAYQAKDTNALRVLSGKMLGLIRDLDALMGTRKESLLGTWLSNARSWGGTEAEKDLCERNARELLTVWTDADSITDYSNRQWNGLLGTFYSRRWELWLKALNESLSTGVPIDETAVRAQIRDWELSWSRKHDRFPTKPHGDVVKLSEKLFARYSADALQPVEKNP